MKKFSHKPEQAIKPLKNGTKPKDIREGWSWDEWYDIEVLSNPYVSHVMRQSMETE